MTTTVQKPVLEVYSQELTMASSSPSTPKRRTMKDLKTPTKRRMFLPSPGTPTTFKSGRKSTVQNHIDTLYTSVSSDLPPLLSTENHNIIMLHAYLGFQTLLVFLSALVHVPSTFPSRMNYVMNIINQFSGKVFSLLEITEITDIIGTCATSKSFMELNLLDLTDVLWDTSLTNKEPYLQFIVPPVKNSCIRKECDGKIYPYSKSFVTLFTSNGPMPGQKAVLRCRQCQTYYHIDNYQIPNRGKQFYPPDIHQDWKCASNRVYFSKDLHELMCESGNHAFVSFQAFAEIYNSVFSEEHPSTLKFSKWKDIMLETSGTEFSLQMKQEEEDIDLVLLNEEGIAVIDCQQDDFSVEEVRSCGTQISMTRKNAGSAYFHGELQNEIWDRSLTDQICLNIDTTNESVMKMVDQQRKAELYIHAPEDCSAYCKSKGCENLRVIDSCWKVCMCHCMFAVPMEVEGYPLLSFPNVCTSEPKVGSVFCREHFDMLTRNNIPTAKEDFLKFIGCSGRPKSQAEIKKVDERLIEFAETLYATDETAQKLGVSALECQGTNDLVSKMRADNWQDDIKEEDLCNKDTGLKSRLRQRSRGHFVCVTGGGHITYFDPIFKSENPTQIFMQVIRLMYLELKDVSAEELDEAIENYILCYDNMCHLDALKCSKADLPLPEPYNKMWPKIKKIVDRLHLVNHKNPLCRQNYNPDDVLPEGYNTMVAEQTFSWFSRFKKIANSMSQTHHLFYIHRNIKRRNRYTAKCRKRGKEPVLPGINSKLSKK